MSFVFFINKYYILTTRSTVRFEKIAFDQNSAIAGPKPGWERRRARSNNLEKKTGFGWLRLIAPCKGPCLGLQILLPCKSGVETPKAKGDNPDRKSWSPRLGVGAVGRLVKKFGAFNERWTLIILFTRDGHWSLLWARWIQSTPSYLTSIRYILILSLYLSLHLPSDLYEIYLL
jgi:hypothetical protein